jgi:4,5-DOPA dioxygenase extradiol
MPSSREPRMPVLFVGHGSPMNAIEDNRWSRGFRSLAGLLPRPKAILSISAHWYVDGTRVTSDTKPETIHDFGGFPPALFQVLYPAPGSPAFAERVRALVGKDRVRPSGQWGLDHGTWSVLVHMFPDADVPVVQLSIDHRLTPRQHYQLARPLASLRDEGVLVLGSGNVTHNLAFAMQHRMRNDDSTPDWALRFDDEVKLACQNHDAAALVERLPASPDGRKSHPTLDHYLPLVYVAASAGAGDPVRFPVEGFDWGSLSMRSVLFE